MKNGEILRGDFASSHFAVFSSIVLRPPMPAPITTPIRDEFSSVTSNPESLMACWDAANPIGTNGSNLRTSLGAMKSSGLKSTTSPPIRHGNADTSSFVIVRIPLRPLQMLSHADATVLPTGETIPNPVMTTLRFSKLESPARVSPGAL
jgi:hypothetical protein